MSQLKYSDSGSWESQYFCFIRIFNWLNKAHPNKKGIFFFFAKSTNLHVNFFQKHPHRHTQNVWLNIWSPCGPVKLICKINHQTWTKSHPFVILFKFVQYIHKSRIVCAHSTSLDIVKFLSKVISLIYIPSTFSQVYMIFSFPSYEVLFNFFQFSIGLDMCILHFNKNCLNSWEECNNSHFDQQSMIEFLLCILMSNEYHPSF